VAIENCSAAADGRRDRAQAGKALQIALVSLATADATRMHRDSFLDAAAAAAAALARM